MFTLSHIRAQARATMQETKGIYLLPVLPVVITILVQLFSHSSINTVSTTMTDPLYDNMAGISLFPLFYGVLMGLISWSISLTIYRLIRQKRSETGVAGAIAVFQHSDFGKILGTYLLKALFLFLWGLIFYIGLALILVASLMIVFLSIALYPGGLPDDQIAPLAILFLSGSVLSLIGLLISLPQYYAYSQVEFILFDRLERGEYTGAYAIIKESRQLMKGFKRKRLVLDLTFIGWFFLTTITFGIAGIYVIPYYTAAQVHFHRALTAEKRQLY